MYLGYALWEGKQWLFQACKVLSILETKNIQQVREFLVSVALCHLWIPGFAELTQLLDEATKETKNFVWTSEQQKIFDKVKWALVSTPALELPDMTYSPFTYV